MAETEPLTTPAPREWEEKLNDALIQVCRSVALAWRQDFVAASAALRTAATQTATALEKTTKQQNLLFGKLKEALGPYVAKDFAIVQMFQDDVRSFLVFAELCKSLVVNAMALRIKAPLAGIDLAAALQDWAYFAEEVGFECGFGKVSAFCKGYGDRVW
jgi:hypothetical protein